MAVQKVAGVMPRVSQLSEGCAVFAQTCQEDFRPDIPHILYGHSLGGNIVTNYLISENLLPDAAVITSPWFTLADQTLHGLKLATAQAGPLFLPPGLLVRSDLDANVTCRVIRAVVDDYLHDPLVHNPILPQACSSKLNKTESKHPAAFIRSIFPCWSCTVPRIPSPPSGRHAIL